MRLLHLTLDNFMGYTGAHALDLDGLGLVHIAGRNLDDPANDSNGSGKSTILEAITWGLWGEGLPRRQGNAEKGVGADEVLPSTSPKQCRVEVRLFDEVAATSYTVARWRKWKPEAGGKATNGVSLAINGEAEESLDTAETSRRIGEVLGIDRDIWTRSVIFGQESQFNFCEATASERSAILTTVMGLEQVDRWLGRCRDERTQLRKDIAGTEGALEVQRHQRVRAEAQSPMDRVADWEKDRHDRLAFFSQKLSDVRAEGERVKAAKVAAQAEADRALPYPEPPVHQVDPRLRATAEAADSAWRKYTATHAQAQAGVQAAQRALQKAQSAVAGVTCPTCGQKVTAAHRDACVAAAASDLAVAQQHEGPARVELERLRAAGAVAQAAFDRDFELERASRDAIARHRSAAAYHQKVIADLEVAYQRARDQWRSTSERIAEVMAETNPHLAAVAEHEARLAELRAEEARLEAIHVDQLGRLTVLDFWDREFPIFKTWMFDSVVDSLAAEANRWLRTMSGGVIWIQISTQKTVGRGSAARVKDELEVTVHRWEPSGSVPTARPYRLWSGGEKRRVALAVDFGLSRLMAGRASKPYSFLAVDEIDRHLDEKGREGLRAVLEELRTERETCMVITHDPDFRASFDREILVTKQGGGSSWEVSSAEQNGEPQQSPA